MKTKRSLTRIGLAAGAILALGLTACSGGNGSDDTDTGDTGDSSETSAPAANTLEELREAGSITLAIASEQPYSWVDENNEATGATVALHREIFQNLGIDNIEVEEVAWDNLIPGLNAGRWDAVSAGMSILPERCEQAAFSDPEIMYTTTLAVPTGNPMGLTDLDSVAAADGVTLAVQTGAIEDGYASDLGITDILNVDSATAGLEAVQTGLADAFALTAVSLNWMTESMSDLETTEAFVQVIDGVEQIGAGSTVFRQGDTELLAAYNEELAKITGSDDAYLSFVEEFGFTIENLPPADLTTEMLCSGDLG